MSAMAKVQTTVFSGHGILALKARRVINKSMGMTMTALLDSSKRSVGRPLQMVPTATWSSMSVVCSANADDCLELQIKIDGMVCDGCSSRVQEALEKTQGVKAVDVNLEKGLATLQLDAPTQMDAFNSFPKLIDIIKDLGFDAEPYFG